MSCLGTVKIVCLLVWYAEELATSLPGLMAQSQKFLDTAMASLQESTSRDELARALQVNAGPVSFFKVLSS